VLGIILGGVACNTAECGTTPSAGSAFLIIWTTCTTCLPMTVSGNGVAVGTLTQALPLSAQSNFPTQPNCGTTSASEIVVAGTDEMTYQVSATGANGLTLPIGSVTLAASHCAQFIILAPSGGSPQGSQKEK
jgi:hypothetical protein